MDAEKILARLVQVGTVTSVDSGRRTARVKFHDTGLISAPLRVLQHHAAGLYIEPDAEHTHIISDTYSGGGSASTFPAHDHLPGSHLTYWMPKVNDAVLVLYLPVPDSDGYILGGI